jgi:hypothetical protein
VIVLASGGRGNGVTVSVTVTVDGGRDFDVVVRVADGTGGVLVDTPDGKSLGNPSATPNTTATAMTAATTIYTNLVFNHSRNFCIISPHSRMNWIATVYMV